MGVWLLCDMTAAVCMYSSGVEAVWACLVHGVRILIRADSR
jgi:hypothetical protein